MKNWEFFIEIYFFCVSKYQLIYFVKLPVNRYLAINIERRKIGQPTVKRTSFIMALNYFFSLFLIIGLVWFMVFNATFNYISVVSWRSVLLAE